MSVWTAEAFFFKLTCGKIWTRQELGTPNFGKLRGDKDGDRQRDTANKLYTQQQHVFSPIQIQYKFKWKLRQCDSYSWTFQRNEFFDETRQKLARLERTQLQFVSMVNHAKFYENSLRRLAGYIYPISTKKKRKKDLEKFMMKIENYELNESINHKNTSEFQSSF